MTVLDASGIYGELMNYMMTIWMVSSAFLIFLYLWKSGRLNLDEDPKWRMLKEEEDVDRRKPE